VPQRGAEQQSVPFLHANNIRLRLRLLSLLQKRLVVKRVSVIEPTVVWREDSEREWRLPPAGRHSLSQSTPEPAATPPPPISAESSPATQPATADEHRATPAKNAEPLEPEIRHVVISGGNFTFEDRTGATVVRFEDVDFGSTLDAAGGVHGHAQVNRVAIRDRIDLSDLRTQVLYDDVTLKLARFGARIAGGKLDGELQVEPQAAGAPFNMTARFGAVDADELIVAAGGKAGMVRGKLDGSLTATGRSGQPNELSGTGEIFLREGQLQQYSLLVALGQVLQIEELTQLHLDQAFAKYHLAEGAVAVDQLLLRSPNIQLSAKGKVGFDGKMHLDAQLAVNEKVQARLFRAIRDNFHPADQPGYAAVEFEVNGTVDHPKSNLVQKLVGRDLKDLGSVINSFLGGKSERKKKKSAQNNEPEPSPAASPEQTAPSP
jgi:hypothetical protein